jgi:hypothetical protein
LLTNLTIFIPQSGHDLIGRKLSCAALDEDLCVEERGGVWRCMGRTRDARRFEELSGFDLEMEIRRGDRRRKLSEV